MRSALLRWGGLLAAAALLVALVLVLRVPQGFSALQEKHQRIRQLQKENSDLLKENQRRQERIRQLKESSAQQEREIRERLKMLREGETSFVLPEQEKKKQP
jgi:cell division protein FtsB